MTPEEKRQQYIDLSHAVQTGIAWSIALENPDCPDVNADPNLRAHKHLRTGIDTSKSDFGALVRLLISKGIFTDEEYFDALLDGMQREKAIHEADLSARLGRNITLG